MEKFSYGYNSHMVIITCITLYNLIWYFHKIYGYAFSKIQSKFETTYRTK